MSQSFDAVLAMSRMFHRKDFVESFFFFFSGFLKAWCPSEGSAQTVLRTPVGIALQAKGRNPCSVKHLLTILPVHHEEMTLGGNEGRQEAKRTEKQRRHSCCWDSPSLMAGCDWNAHVVTVCQTGKHSDIEKTHALTVLAKHAADKRATKHKWQTAVKTRRNLTHCRPERRTACYGMLHQCTCLQGPRRCKVQALTAGQSQQARRSKRCWEAVGRQGMFYLLALRLLGRQPPASS